MRNILSEFEFGDMQVCYIEDGTGKTGLEIIPKAFANSIVKSKEYAVDPLIDVSVRGDAYSGGFANGHTMRGGQSTENLHYDRQSVEQDGGVTIITTVLKTTTGHIAKHILTYRENTKAFRVKTVYANESDEPITLEMLSSFSLGGITPFCDGDAENTLVAHKIRSCWSAEGRVDSTAIEQLQLEPSWARYGVRSDKFGQTGSMPVRKFFPFLAVEDTAHNVLWASQLACATSWQLELYRRDAALCMSGGLADYDFGHFAKTLKPHESFETPEAILTVGVGNLDTISQRLLTVQEKSPVFKERLPVLFNEFCTTWGKPTQENIEKILGIIKSKGFDYFIIDSGWFADKINGWDGTHGDWDVGEELFPQGLEKVVALIKDSGLKPGIWFEFETCGHLSKLYHNEDHLLKRNGSVITVGTRRFLDMRDDWVKAYLKEKVIEMLGRYGFDYLKVDYNDSTGIGCDGAESLGEGLRENILASQAFFQKIKVELPDIVIENCSSGGHRLEPSMMALCDMASFSDAHECLEIPIIAANMHRVIQPAKSQIWGVLRKSDSLTRVVYTMANTFLGVMCLSGDIYDLDAGQWAVVDSGIAFYNAVSHIIKDGTTEFFGPAVESYRHPEGWQGIVRYAEDKPEALAVIHTFAGTLPDAIEIPLNKKYTICKTYGNDQKIALEGNLLTIRQPSNFEAFAVYLTE